MSRLPAEPAVAAPSLSRARDAALVTRIRLRARRQVYWLERLWAGTPALGLSISAHEVQRILSDGESDDAARDFYETDAVARALTVDIAEQDAATASDSLLTRLRHELRLSDPEVDLLTLTVAVEADPWLRRVFGYIHDDATCVLPTPWLARQLFEWPPDTRIGPESSLLRWRLARPLESHGEPWSLTTPWVADASMVRFLLDGVSIDAAIGHAICVAGPMRVPAPGECVYPDALATIVEFVAALSASRTSASAVRPLEIVIAGPDGAGKRTLAAQACAQLMLPLVIADLGALAAPAADGTATRDAYVRVIRTARLLGAAVYWHGTDAGNVRHHAIGAPPVSFFSSADAAPGGGDDAVRRTVRLTPLTQAGREAFWSRLSARPAPAPVRDWPLLPADMVRAATAAPAGPEAVVEACRATLRVESGSIALPLPCPFVWDDLVLAASVRQHVEDFERHARLRWPVYEGWGFGRLCPMGRGVSALFAGPSGTGKTMAAQVVARALGMAIYRVDLASVMSKYIGETEKNLRRVFDACEHANVLLFFDEADALFGQRTQVKDAHDRFANIEIDYLLQRMEQFDGVAVLATNRKKDIDSAFLRRVGFIIDFLPPGIPERRELWTRALPARAPSGDELLDTIDWDGLARNLTMTGADIKNAAIGAAFLAHSEGTRIGMRHVMRAARRELAKHGMLVRAVEGEQ